MAAVRSDELDWNKLADVGALDVGILPVAVHDVDTKDVIMIAYMSRESLAETVRTGQAVFSSTSQQQLHRKGATSGDVLELVGLRANCDANSILMEVRKRGTGACHERDEAGEHFASCFFRQLEVDPAADGQPASRPVQVADVASQRTSSTGRPGQLAGPVS